ncbi:glycosyltransferase [Pontibacter diazotrophicus]|uniref:Glycosyltransferase n=1 Tax=Pontibacter diazotrophicus TaxID=1400979 RepID=A0A3D8L1M5_9BACT|nr:glycosyltransferase [Pontibacter diazotrophicus]RDV11097.1 glycosyltransferase [Pontibacter diazotrophicus]
MHEINRPSTIIYEGSATGHRKEYIEYLLIHLQANPQLKSNYLFMLNDELKQQLSEEIETVGDLLICEISMEGAPTKLLARAYWEWHKIEKVILDTPTINTILFMSFDGYQYLVQSPVFTKHKLKVQGILFQPYHHLPSVEVKDIASFKLRLRKLRKFTVIWSLINLNRRVNKIYILNDEEGVKKLNAALDTRGEKVFYYLPDPIDTRNLLDVNTETCVRIKYSISRKRQVLLLFGRIDEKKNLNNILDSLALFSEDEQAKIALIVAGTFVDGKAQSIKCAIAATQNKNPKLQIIIRDEVIPNYEMEQLFKACDIVLMPYIDFYSSSGVIGHAAKYKKQVVVSSSSINKSIVEIYNLGVAVNPYSPLEIKDAIAFLVTQLNSYNKSNDKLDYFIQNHNYSSFGKSILI